MISKKNQQNLGIPRSCIKKDVIEDEFILKQRGGYVPKAVFVEKYDTDS